MRDFYPGFVLQRKTTPVLNDQGTDASVDSTVAFDGAIRKLRARDVMAGGKTVALSTHRIYSEVSVQINPCDEITFGGKTYVVVHSDDVMGRGELRQTDVELRD